MYARPHYKTVLSMGGERKSDPFPYISLARREPGHGDLHITSDLTLWVAIPAVHCINFDSATPAVTLNLTTPSEHLIITRGRKTLA